MRNAHLRHLILKHENKKVSRYCHGIIFHVYALEVNLVHRACFTKCLEYKWKLIAKLTLRSTEIWCVKHFTFTSGLLLLMETWAGGVSACVWITRILFVRSQTQVNQVFAGKKWGVLTAREQSTPLSWTPLIYFTLWPPPLTWVAVQHQSLYLKSGS